MADAGFYRGTSADQDSRFADKQRKMLQQMKFDDILKEKVNVAKLNLDVIKPWITGRINDILGIEDDVVIEFVFSQLEEKTVDPRVMQINLTGFLNAKRSREFVAELWKHLVEAQAEPDGIPPALVELKMQQMQKKRDEENAVRRAAGLAEASRRSPPGRRYYGYAAPTPTSSDDRRDRDKDRDREDKERRERERNREKEKREEKERERQREKEREREREGREREKARQREAAEQSRNRDAEQRAKEKEKERERNRSPERRRYTEKRAERRKFTEAPAADDGDNARDDDAKVKKAGHEPMGPTLPPADRRQDGAKQSARKADGAASDSDSNDECAGAGRRRRSGKQRDSTKRSRRAVSSSSSSSSASSAGAKATAAGAAAAPKKADVEAKLRQRALQSLKRKSKGDP